MGKPFIEKCSDSKIIGQKYLSYSFVEDTNFYIIHGMAKKSKESM